LLFKAIGLLFKLIGLSFSLAFGLLALVISALPFILIGCVIYHLYFKKNSAVTNSNTNTN